MDRIEAASKAACRHQGADWETVSPEIKDMYRGLVSKILDAWKAEKKNGKGKKKKKDKKRE
jgi:hypothetical protein